MSMMEDQYTPPLYPKQPDDDDGPLPNKVRDKRKRRLMDIEQLAADFTRAFIEIREVPPTEKGKARFWIELSAPQSVRDALDAFCERQGIDVADYLEDIGRELIVTAARK